MSNDRPRRLCRDRAQSQQEPSVSSLIPFLFQSSTQQTARSVPTRSIMQQPRTSSTSQQLPVIVQPSPRPTQRAQARVENQPTQLQPLATHSSVQDNVHEQVTCPMCALDVNDSGLICDRCDTWFHYRCLFITDQEFF